MMHWAGNVWIPEERDVEPTLGMLFHRPDGLAGCPVCGWFGVPTRGDMFHMCPSHQLAAETDVLYAATGGAAVPARIRTKVPRMAVQVGRNEPCPCGSGRKFKKCCGA